MYYVETFSMHVILRPAGTDATFALISITEPNRTRCVTPSTRVTGRARIDLRPNPAILTSLQQDSLFVFLIRLS